MRRLTLMTVAVTAINMSILAGADQPEIKVIGRDGEKAVITAAQLKSMPRVEVEVKERDGAMVRFSGVEMSELLRGSGVPQGEKLRGEWLSSFVTIDAKDKYRAIFALPEFDASFTDRKVILADTRNGAALDEKHGPFQIIVADEKRFSRWVRMVTEIRVVDSRIAEKTGK